MQKLSRESLMSLAQYAEQRKVFRDRVIEHKRNRKIHIGEHVTLYFEDCLTIQYQIQEMLRIEHISEHAAIDGELAAYTPLIPDGSNLKATFMIEYEDVEQRKVALTRLVGIERQTWMRVGEYDKIYPIANEDLERETKGKTSAVHFLRFEFSPEMIQAIKAGAQISMGIDHPEYTYQLNQIPANVYQSLGQDFA